MPTCASLPRILGVAALVITLNLSLATVVAQNAAAIIDAAQGIAPPGAASFRVDGYEQLRARAALQLAAVELGDGRVVELDLRRFEVFAPMATLVGVSSGQERALSRPRVALFSGSVSEDERGLAFLAVAEQFTYGFVSAFGRTYVISSGPIGAGMPTMICDLAAMPIGQRTDLPICSGAPPMIDNMPTRADDTPGDEIFDRGSQPCRTVTFAIDTDAEYTTLLGGAANATAYAATLFGAGSAIYTRDLNVRFQISYLRLWEDANDPWTQLDTGDQLGEFRTIWDSDQGGIYRNLAHFLSGRGLGGGVAWLNAVCDPSIGYGLSANLNGSFPHPLASNRDQNWDVVVTTHEIGHNFDAPHTHQMAVDIDGCGDGDCSLAAQGTIMSYCHQCSGGIGNIALEFHPRTIAEEILPFLNSSGMCRLDTSPLDGRSVYFDGSNDTATVAGFGAITPTTEVTIEFWAYADRTGSHSVISTAPGGTTNRINILLPTGQNRATWEFGNTTGGRLNYTAPDTITERWVHWAFVASQSGNYMRTFRNGAQVASKVGMTPMTANASSLYVGSLGGASGFMRGRVADVRVWNVARAPADIASNYQQRLVGNEPGLLVYLKLDEPTGAATYADSSAAAGVTNATPSGTMAVEVSGCFDATGACCLPSGECVDAPASDCDIWGGRYSGDGTSCGSTPCETFGTCCIPQAEGFCALMWESDCTAAGGVPVGLGSCQAMGPFNGYGVTIAGASGYITMGNSPIYNFTSGGFSVEAWIRTDVSSGVQRLVARGVPGGSGWAFGTAGKRLRLSLYGQADLTTVNEHLVEGVWTHVGVVFDESLDARFFVNGQRVETIAGAVAPASSIQPLFLGRNSASTLNPYTGTLDELRIWNTTRSDAEMAFSFDSAVNVGDPALVGYWRFDESGGTNANDLSQSGLSGTLVGPIGRLELTACPRIDCDGDVDGDRDVDLSDLSTLLANFGVQVDASRQMGDLDGDGDVDLSDLSALLGRFGTDC